MKKRMNLLFPTLALCLFLLPATAGAASEPVPVSDLATLRSKLQTDGADIYLEKDIYVNDSDTLLIGDNVTLYVVNNLTSSTGELHIQGGSLTIYCNNTYGTLSPLYLDSGSVTLSEGLKIVGSSGKEIENVSDTSINVATLKVTAGSKTDTVATNFLQHTIKINGMEYRTSSASSEYAYQLTVDREGTVTQLNGGFDLKTKGTNVLVGQGGAKVESGSDTGYVAVVMNGVDEGTQAHIQLWNGGTAVINGASYTEANDPDSFVRLGTFALTTEGKIKYGSGTVSVGAGGTLLLDQTLLKNTGSAAITAARTYDSNTETYNYSFTLPAGGSATYGGLSLSAQNETTFQCESGGLQFASTALVRLTTANGVEYQVVGSATVAPAGSITLTGGYLTAAPGAVVSFDGATIENTGTGQLSFYSGNKNQFSVMNGDGSAKVNGVALSRIGVADKLQVESGVVTRALTAEEHLTVEGVLYTAREGGATLTIAPDGGVTWSGSYFIEYAADEPSYTLIAEGGKTLADAGLTADPSWPAGVLGWVDSEGGLLPDSTAVAANTAYTWRFTPGDTSCYRILEDTVVLYTASTSGSSSGSSSGGSSSSSNRKTTAKQNPDGSTTVSVSSKDAKNGETVTLPVEVSTEDPAEINVNIPKGSSVTVEIPVENVTPGTVVVIVDEDGNETVVATTGLTENGVTVTLTENCTIKVIENATDFDDVPEGSYYGDAVAWASARGITGGVGGNNFGAENDCGRAQLVTFLWRAAGQPEASGDQTFSDVDDDAYYTEAVKWAASLDIVTGYDSGLFGTNDVITREQMAVILYRFAQAVGLDTTQEDTAAQEYDDYEEISDYAVAAMQWAVNFGVMQGYDGNLMPGAECTRAQIVTMLYRLLGM